MEAILIFAGNIIILTTLNKVSKQVGSSITPFYLMKFKNVRLMTRRDTSNYRGNKNASPVFSLFSQF